MTDIQTAATNTADMYILQGFVLSECSLEICALYEVMLMEKGEPAQGVQQYPNITGVSKQVLLRKT